MLGCCEDDLQYVCVNDIHPEKDLPYVIEEFEKLARKESGITKDIPEMIRETLDGVERISSIVRDMKCFSRVDESEQKFADIIQCLESTLNIANNELKYKATIKLLSHCPLISPPSRLFHRHNRFTGLSNNDTRYSAHVSRRIHVTTD